MIPFLLAITFSILLTLVFVMSGSGLFDRWLETLGGGKRRLNIDDMKVPTFYAIYEEAGLGIVLSFPVAGVIFGGIHCAGRPVTVPYMRCR